MLRTTTLLAPLVFLIFSCGNPSDTETETVTISDTSHFIRLPENGPIMPGWSKSNTIVYHLPSEPDMLHPTNGTTSARAEILQYTQMYLVRTDMRTLEPAPALLETYPVLESDGVSYNCTLRNDVFWDNGSPITSEDVVFTAKANVNPYTDNPATKSFWNNLKEIVPDATNPKKFRVVMKSPSLYNILIWSDFPIMQKSFFDPGEALYAVPFQQLTDTSKNTGTNTKLIEWSKHFNSADYARNPKFLTGAGAYKVTSWSAGQELVLEKKSQHWSDQSKSHYEKAYPDKIIFRINKDPNSQLLEFKQMTYDGSNSVSAATLSSLLSDSNFVKNYHAKFTDSFSYSYIAMNNRPDGVKHPMLFSDKNVRKAISMLVPYDAMNQVVNQGRNKRMIGPVSILKKEFDTTLQVIRTNPEEALRLLYQSGWSDSDSNGVLDKSVNGKKTEFRFVLSYHINSPEWKDYAVLMKESFAKSGVIAELQPLDVTALFANARSHDFDMFIASLGQSAAPEDFTQIWHTASWSSNGSNYSGFGNKESDALIDSLKSTVDLNKRIPLSHRLQKMVYDEQPLIFLFCSTRRNIIHKRFGNAEMYFERPGIQLNQLILRTNTIN
ncbi:MAG: ABC transporter substrate-binding protein [Bacteroidota bacterium]